MYTHNKTAKNRFLNIDIVRNETRKYDMIYQVGKTETQLKYKLKINFLQFQNAIISCEMDLKM